jgi:hypothetical protein
VLVGVDLQNPDSVLGCFQDFLPEILREVRSVVEHNYGMIEMNVIFVP